MVKEIISNFIFNKNAVLFAINNTCNCKCEMCSIWKNKDKKIVKLEEAKDALLKLYKNNFGILQITGGEPLLNPDVFSIINYAKKLNFLTFLVTNGTLINESVARQLSEAKVDNVGISFHHHDQLVFEKISNHTNILNKVKNAIKFLKDENIPVEALFTISKYNKNDIEKTVELINSLGIGVSFCTPMIVKNTSFSIGGKCVEFSNDELKDIILEIINLKKNGYRIINSITFLKEVLNFLERRNKYYCLGGYRIFYLDWNLNFYPCMFKGSPIKLKDVDFNFKKTKCKDCFFQCFLEPSLLLLSRSMSIKITMQQLPVYFKLMKFI